MTSKVSLGIIVKMERVRYVGLIWFYISIAKCNKDIGISHFPNIAKPKFKVNMVTITVLNWMLFQIQTSDFWLSIQQWIKGNYFTVFWHLFNFKMCNTILKSGVYYPKLKTAFVRHSLWSIIHFSCLENIKNKKIVSKLSMAFRPDPNEEPLVLF